MSKIVEKINSVTLIEHIEEDLDVLEVEIGFSKHFAIGSYNTFLGLIGNYVEYTVRKDLYKGQKVSMINTVADVHTVQAIDKDADDVKLIAREQGEMRPVCNFNVSALKLGDNQTNTIVLVSNVTFDASNRAKWCDIECIDIYSKVFNLRMFTSAYDSSDFTENLLKSAVGKYIKCDIASTKYGYQTSDIEVLEVDVIDAPEVQLAREVVKDIMDKYPELVEYDRKYDFLNNISNIVMWERGYHLVIMASEIYFINSLKNITNDYDIDVLYKAVFTSRGYLIPSKTKFSKQLLNVHRVQSTSMGTDKKLLLLLDVGSEEVSTERDMFVTIQKLVDKIVSKRRGIDNEKDSDSSVADVMYNLYGRLW